MSDGDALSGVFVMLYSVRSVCCWHFVFGLQWRGFARKSKRKSARATAPHVGFICFLGTFCFFEGAERGAGSGRFYVSGPFFTSVLQVC